AQRILQRKAPQPPERAGEGFPVEPLHHVIRCTVSGDTSVGNTDDVGVLQTTQGPPLVAQALNQVLALAKLIEQRLEHETFPEFDVLNLVDRAHSALSNLRNN